MDSIQGMLKKTWPSTLWSRSKLMVPLPQSALRPRNALNDNDLHGFRTKQVESEEKTLSDGLLGIKNKKKKTTIKLSSEKIHLWWSQCICSFFYSVWATCMCEAVLGLLGVWSKPVQFQQMSCGGRRRGRSTGECQLWVQEDGCLEKLVLVFLVHMCFTASAWRQSHHAQAEACLAQCDVPHIPSDMQEVSGKRGHREKSGPNAKRFADYTHMEIHRSTIITSILSPNLILCKVILGLGIA